MNPPTLLLNELLILNQIESDFLIHHFLQERDFKLIPQNPVNGKWKIRQWEKKGDTLEFAFLLEEYLDNKNTNNEFDVTYYTNCQSTYNHFLLEMQKMEWSRGKINKTDEAGYITEIYQANPEKYGVYFSMIIRKKESEGIKHYIFHLL